VLVNCDPFAFGVKVTKLAFVVSSTSQSSNLLFNKLFVTANTALLFGYFVSLADSVLDF